MFMMVLICSYVLFFKSQRCLLQTDCFGKTTLSPELKAGILDSPGTQVPQTSITKTIHVVFLPIQGCRGRILYFTMHCLSV